MSLFEKLGSIIETHAKSAELSKDKIAEMLKVSPERLAEFENYYKKEILEKLPANTGNLNAKQATEITDGGILSEYERELANRIIDELVAQTEVYVYDGETASVHKISALPDSYSMVTKEDLEKLPAESRPQLTGNLMSVDIKENSSSMLMWHLSELKKEKNPEKKKWHYDHFRQGLDILDLDPLTYAIIGTNRNSMGHWLPQLVEANAGLDFFKIPATRVAKVPVTLLQLTRKQHYGNNTITKAIVNGWATRVFALKPDGDYFVKTGTYSSKFDFRNCHVTTPKEVGELGEYLLFIHGDACMKAGPLCRPSIYGMSTTNEWCVREYVKDIENNPVIYKGLPLHTEYRVFIDCDTKEVLGMMPYWEPETMKKRFEENRDGHDAHDYISYKAHEEMLTKRYENNKDRVLEHVEDLLPRLELTGQWSLDIMQNGNDFWLIDMAVAENSFGYNMCVKLEDRHPVQENWLPDLNGGKNNGK